MLVSNKSVTKTQIAIVIAWLSFTVAAFGYAISDKLVNFDFSNKLQGIEHKQLASYMKPYLDPLMKNVGNTVLHFSKPNCDCQKTSEQHIQEINKLASDNSFNIVNVVINQHEIIPSTPSVAIMDNEGGVVYFGPYGQGLACSQTSGYAQTMLNNFLKGYSANMIVKEAKGCYCEV